MKASNVLTMYANLKTDELQKGLLSFQVEHRGNISNPRITGLENKTPFHSPNPSS